METIAAITTAKAIAAISGIEIVGSDSQSIIRKIFISAGPREIDLIPGSAFVGKVVDENETIDHVVLGCLDVNDFEISCHGNPLIVEKVAKLLVRCGAKLVSAEQLLYAKLQSSNPSLNAIQIESNIAQLKAATLKGVELIANQPAKGLGQLCSDWLDNFDSLDLEEIKISASDVLGKSNQAQYLIRTVKAVLAGPPNSGKSTLLNALAGKQKAIVTDVAGTTRDWLSTTIKTENILVEFYDTAGIDKALAGYSNSDSASQDTSFKLVSEADMILFVVDGSQDGNFVEIDFPKDKKTIFVYNKSDLGQAACVNVKADATVSISAKDNRNIDSLIQAVQNIAGVDDVIADDAVCFTERQSSLLKKIINSNDKDSAKTAISQLLISPLYV